MEANYRSANQMNQIFNQELQRRLDFLDEYIDTLEREKQAAGDNDLSVIEEAKSIHQKARQHYSQGELRKAWQGVFWSEGCILCGHTELADWNNLSSSIDKLLSRNA